MKKIKRTLKKFNHYLADRLSYVLSIMGTFYVVFLLVTLPLFFEHPRHFVEWASYLCTVVFQGLALPVIGYTSRIASDKTDKLMQRLKKTTDRTEQLATLIKNQQEEIHQLVEIISHRQGTIQEGLGELLNPIPQLHHMSSDSD
jgi:hypothetical protein